MMKWILTYLGGYWLEIAIVVILGGSIAVAANRITAWHGAYKQLGTVNAELAGYKSQIETQRNAVAVITPVDAAKAVAFENETPVIKAKEATTNAAFRAAPVVAPYPAHSDQCPVARLSDEYGLCFQAAAAGTDSGTCQAPASHGGG